MESRSRRVAGRVGEHLASYVGRPGKMLRSRFCLLLGRALRVDPEKAEGVARAVEFVHNASLLHDDCVDHADTRRGEPTPNVVFGTTVALLLGDLAFSQGLEEAVDISPSAPRLLVSTVREMTVGELQEEFLKGSLDLTVEAYIGIAARKTGALFEWAGSVLSELAPAAHEKADPPRLASSAGILLQIVDDIHDYTLPEGISGKPQGQDVSNRRVTLPVLLALRGPKRNEFLKIWEGGDSKAVADFLRNNAIIEAARDTGREIVASMMALCEHLPDRDGARELAAFIEVMSRREF